MVDRVRKRAVEILLEVERRGVPLDPFFSRSLKDHPLQGRAFLRELVYGVLRLRARLDHSLRHYSRLTLHQIDPVVLTILRVGAYQLLFLRTPAWAAVKEMVEVTKGMGKRGAAGFVNAVLRRVAEGGEPPFPDPEADPVAHLSLFYSHPPWAVNRWFKRWGWEETRRLCETNNLLPPFTLRVNTLRGSREELLDMLQKEGREAHLSPYSPWGIVLEDPEGLFEGETFHGGWFFVQDEGAQLVTALLDPQPGERILDLCAAPGGKTTHIAQLMGNEGQVVAVDISQGRLDFLRQNCQRLGIEIVQPLCCDASRPLPLPPQGFDRVLVDVPCTGSGVWRRNPDGRWRVKEKDLYRLPPLQLSLLKEGARMLRDGGVLLYSTCSLMEEENEEVLERFLQETKGFLLKGPPSGMAQDLFTPEGYLLTLPQRHGTDGFFAALLQKG